MTDLPALPGALRARPDILGAKTAEMDRLLYILEQMKEVAKVACEQEYQQPRLLDAPQKAEYP